MGFPLCQDHNDEHKLATIERFLKDLQLGWRLKDLFAGASPEGCVGSQHVPTSPI
jgi:hypothetical protein